MAIGRPKSTAPVPVDFAPELTQITASSVEAFDEWLAIGRGLAQQRRDVDWKLGDWLVAGQSASFVDQIQFEFLADQLGLSPKRLKSAATVAEHFPPATRDETLSVEHHVNVASLPAPDALAVLKQAKEAHWTPEETRIEAVRRKAEIEPPLIDESDWEQHEFVAICRAFNRARESARQLFVDQIAETGLRDIDA